jgi:hypothetical protein
MRAETVVTIKENDIIFSGEGFGTDDYPSAEMLTAIEWARQRLDQALAVLLTRSAAKQIIN